MKWLAELQMLPELSVDRCLKPETFVDPMMTELHHFSDATEAGYRLPTSECLTTKARFIA